MQNSWTQHEFYDNRTDINAGAEFAKHSEGFFRRFTAYATIYSNYVSFHLSKNRFRSQLFEKIVQFVLQTENALPPPQLLEWLIK